MTRSEVSFEPLTAADAERWAPWAPPGSWCAVDDLKEREQLSAELERLRVACASERAQFEAAVEGFERCCERRVVAEALGHLSRMEEERRTELARLASNVAELAAALATALVRERCASDPALLAPRVAQILEARTSPPAALRVAPDAAELLRRALSGDGCMVRVAPDEALGPGDLVIEYDGGELDCRVATLVATARGAMEAELARRERAQSSGDS